jgi:hypothetical protein
VTATYSPRRPPGHPWGPRRPPSRPRPPHLGAPPARHPVQQPASPTPSPWLSGEPSPGLPGASRPPWGEGESGSLAKIAKGPARSTRHAPSQKRSRAMSLPVVTLCERGR